MMPDGAAVLDTTVTALLAILSVAILISFVRLIKGPSVPDRVIALDLIAIQAVGIIAVHAIGSNQPTLLDAAIVFALIVFLGTVILARYLERGGSR
jgi:multicomponent Na+:H+ antiporter subunit F